MSSNDRLDAPLDAMTSTRQAVLSTLKRAGPSRAKDLAVRLGVTVAAVRQQLARLSEDGLVTHRVDPAGRGRPSHHYELTAAAEELFPKRYGDLTAELLGYLGGPTSEEVRSLFEMRRKRRIAAARARLSGKSLADKVDELAAILDEDGYLADVERLGPGHFRITEHNCAILSVANSYRQACTSELGFIKAVLGEAAVRRVAHLMDGAHVCAYEVRERIEAPALRPSS